MAKIGFSRKVRGWFAVFRGTRWLIKGNRLRDESLEVGGAFEITRGVTLLELDKPLIENVPTAHKAILVSGYQDLARRMAPEVLAGYRKDGTLGNALRLQREQGMDPGFYRKFIENIDLERLTTLEAVRLRASQAHDLYHLLTGYPTDPDGEIAIFMFGASQNNAYGPLFISVASAVSELLKDPRRLPHVLRVLVEAWQAGQKVSPFRLVNFAAALDRDIGELRVELGIPPEGLWAPGSGATSRDPARPPSDPRP